MNLSMVASPILDLSPIRPAPDNFIGPQGESSSYIKREERQKLSPQKIEPFRMSIGVNDQPSVIKQEVSDLENRNADPFIAN